MGKNRQDSRVEGGRRAGGLEEGALGGHPADGLHEVGQLQHLGQLEPPLGLRRRPLWRAARPASSAPAISWDPSQLDIDTESVLCFLIKDTNQTVTKHDLQHGGKGMCVKS